MTKSHPIQNTPPTHGDADDPRRVKATAGGGHYCPSVTTATVDGYIEHLPVPCLSLKIAQAGGRPLGPPEVLMRADEATELALNILESVGSLFWADDENQDEIEAAHWEPWIDRLEYVDQIRSLVARQRAR